jgi:hypothetical protein
MRTVCVRLIRKLAEKIDGVDLSRRSVGQIFSLPGREADLLVAERWAELAQPETADRKAERRGDSHKLPLATAADIGSVAWNPGDQSGDN